MSKEDYRNEIINMVNRIENFNILESIYWFVRIAFGKKGSVK